MSKWITLSCTALALACVLQATDVEARGRNYGYCPNCQYSVPTITLPAAQAPAPPADGDVEPVVATPLVNSGYAGYSNSYGQGVQTRRMRWFGRFRN